VLTWDGANSIHCATDITAASGMVGIGIGGRTPYAPLEVNGEILPGTVTTGHTCTHEGAFAYDNAQHTPVYCNASHVWSKMGAAATPLEVDQVYSPASAGGMYTATCPPNTNLTGGGCMVGGGALELEDDGASGNTWNCFYSGYIGDPWVGSVTAQAFCLPQ
jgi:hypothetical protein